MGEVLGGGAHRRGRHVVHAGQHGRDVDVLGGQARAQHIVRGGHDLHAQAGDVGVHAAGGHEQRLTGPQGDRVEQERRRDPGVAGEGAGHGDGVGVHPPGGGLPPPQAPRELGGQVVDLLAGGPRPDGDQVGEDLADAEAGGVEDEGAAHPPCQARLQARQDLRGTPRRPEPGHGLEVLQGQDHLGLVVGVLVVAQRVGGGYPGLVLQGVALGGLLQGGVHLEGEHLVGGDHLEQVGQLGAEATHHVGTQEPLGLGGDELLQGGGRGVPRGVHQVGGPVGVGAQPQLGPRLAVRLLAQEVEDGRRRAPVVALTGSGKSFHGRHRSLLPARPRIRGGGLSRHRPRQRAREAGVT